MRCERLYLEDILAAADAIAEFTQAQNFESFKANRSVENHLATVTAGAVAAGI